MPPANGPPGTAEFHDLSMHSTHDEFFTKLTDLFNSRTKSGKPTTVYLMQKRLDFLAPAPFPSSKTSALGPASPESTDSGIALNPFDPPALPSAPILVRATNGKGGYKDESGKVVKSKKGKVKFGTVVQAGELEGFYERYAACCREGMASLRKKDKKKGKKKGKGKGGEKEAGVA